MSFAITSRQSLPACLLVIRLDEAVLLLVINMFSDNHILSSKKGSPPNVYHANLRATDA
jgi:hypothetical protein